MRGSYTAKRDVTREKYDVIYQRYLELLAQEGKKAAALTKTYFYAQLADQFYLSTDHVARIIRDKVNGGK